VATERFIPDRHLRTARLLLRPLTLADLPEYVRFRMVSAAHLRPWEPLPPADKTVEE
jgi:RimJ/RimL family protein N-acetyltransferase